MAVGDAQDVARYARYAQLQERAALQDRQAEKASSVRETLAARDRADALRREAFYLFV